MSNPSVSPAESWRRRFEGAFATTKASGKILRAKSRVTH
jgi:hypothetical protein